MNVDLAGLLNLLAVQGIGHGRVRRLVDHFGSPEAVFSARADDLRRIARIDRMTAQAILQGGHDRFGRDQVTKARDTSVSLLSYWDSEYPRALKQIFNPPALIFIRGNLPSADRICVAVVGTRRPTSYGKSVAETLSRDLSCRRLCVVSGLARGIDTWAHRGALKGEGGTIAFLGSGVDVVYPPENARLVQQIVQNGALVSEFPLGTRPAPAHFPRRNRLISGMSMGTVVVEAGEKSGALITAYLAMEQGREVFAVPGEVSSHRSRGPHKLLKEGAKLVETVEDVLSEISGYEDTKGSSEMHKSPVQLSSQERVVWNHLSDKPAHIDLIASAAGVSTPSVMALLLSMELKDCVRQLPGMLFVRQ